MPVVSMLCRGRDELDHHETDSTHHPRRARRAIAMNSSLGASASLFTRPANVRPTLHVASPPAARAYPKAHMTSTPASPSSQSHSQRHSPATALRASATALAAATLSSPQNARSHAPSPLGVYGIVADSKHRPRRDGRFFERAQATVDLSRHALQDADCMKLAEAFFDEVSKLTSVSFISCRVFMLVCLTLRFVVPPFIIINDPSCCPLAARLGRRVAVPAAQLDWRRGRTRNRHAHI